MTKETNWNFQCPFCGTSGFAFETVGYCPDCDSNFAREDVEGDAGAVWSARVTTMQFCSF